jgi:uncharacterized protein (DUF433 family)
MSKSNPMSLRLGEATIERLGSRAKRVHMPPRTLAQRYVEEGLRMDEHPLVRFVDGPAGRRARLVGTGKDVWQVIATIRDNDNDLHEAAEYLRLPFGLVQAAVAYYGAYTSEVDELIADNERMAEEARAAWVAGQAALTR